jgi:hypothetical protein
MSEPKWIVFDLLPRLDRRTDHWHVWTKDRSGFLGEIKWFGRWRKYSFFPAPSTVFEPTCLRDITTFIESEMQKRKEAR